MSSGSAENCRITQHSGTKNDPCTYQATVELGENSWVKGRNEEIYFNLGHIMSLLSFSFLHSLF